jgi:RNA polymerase sigma factor (sigma-70 family)
MQQTRTKAGRTKRAAPTAPEPAESAPVGDRRHTTVFLVDDHEIVRRGLRELFDDEEDLEVIGDAGTYTAALEQLEELHPDVAVLDVRLPDGSGVELCRQIRSEHPETECLMLTTFADDEALRCAALAGASGYVLKQVRGNDLVDGVRRASAGDAHLDEATVERMIAQMHVSGELEKLSPQERRIFDLIPSGMTNREIGEEMGLAEKTVKNYVSNLLAKLGMDRRTEVAAFAGRLDERRAEALRHG